jgi:hypothetical protein
VNEKILIVLPPEKIKGILVLQEKRKYGNLSTEEKILNPATKESARKKVRFDLAMYVKKNTGSSSKK